MTRIAAKYFKSSEGSTAVEYGLIAGLVALALVASLTSIGQGVNKPLECSAEVIEGTKTAC